jgi:hypothetical protein
MDDYILCTGKIWGENCCDLFKIPPHHLPEGKRKEWDISGYQYAEQDTY